MTAPAVPVAPETPGTRPTPDELRAEALDLLTGPLAEPAWRRFVDQRASGVEPDPRPLFRLLGAHGLLAPAWPTGYGGRGLTARHAAAVVAAMVQAGVPETLHTLSVQICGNFLRSAGTHAQQASWLPGLACGERFATVLYSEPEVGSDLAALSTRADPDPSGGWRLSGRKVYSVKTHCADVGLVAARTGQGASRYQGITLFLLPLDTPGVQVRALPSVADERFADVELDGAWVPDTAVVGPVGGAWPLVVDALALERTGVDYHAKATTWLDLWRATTPAPDDGQRVEAARHATAVTAAGLLSGRCLDQLDAGRVDPVLAATTKLWCADVARSVAWWCAEELGPEAVWRWPDPAAPADGRLEAAYREAPGLTISAGTAEMMVELVSGALPGTDGDLPGLDDEPLARQVRTAVRTAVTGFDDRDDPGEWWPLLAALEVFALDVPAAAGGLGLGLPAAAIGCAELGRAALDGGVLDTLTAADALVAADTRGDLVSELAAGRVRVLLADHRSGRPGVLAGAGHADAALVVEDGPVLRWHAPAPARARIRPSRADVPLWVPDRAAAGGEPLVDGARAGVVLCRDQIRRAAWLTGLATGALAHTVHRARTRRQFGRALLDNQDVAFRLGRLAARTVATRLVVEDAAGAAELTGDRPGTAEAAGALAAAAELALAASREAVHLHGAYGMTEHAPAQRYYRAAMVTAGLAGPVRALWRTAAGAGPVDPPASSTTKGER